MHTNDIASTESSSNRLQQTQATAKLELICECVVADPEQRARYCYCPTPKQRYTIVRHSRHDDDHS